MSDTKWNKHKFCRDMECKNYYHEISECMVMEPEIELLNFEQKCMTNRELFESYKEDSRPDVKFN